MKIEQPDAERSIDDLKSPDADNNPERPSRAAAMEGWIQQRVATWRPILLTLLIIGALGLVGGMYLYQYAPDRHVGDVTAQQVVRAASDGTVAMLSYSPKSLDEDFARAKSYLAGDLLAYYSKFSDEIMGPTAKEKQTATFATVIRAAVSELHKDHAVVLVFINQSTTTRDNPEPTVTENSALATMVNVDGSWLIAKFDRL